MGAANDKLAKGDACWPKEEKKVYVKPPEQRIVKIPYYANKIMIKTTYQPEPKKCPKAPASMKKKLVPSHITSCELQDEKPCDPCEPVENCPEPRICKYKIKNPYEHMWETRCKGPNIPVEACQKQPAPPASLPPCGPTVCIPAKEKKPEPCPVPALRKDKVKNLPPKDDKCHPHPEDFISRPLCDNKELLKIKIPKQERRPGERIQVDPFHLIKCKRKAEQEDREAKTKKKDSDPNDYKYSRTLCRYKAVLVVKPEAPPKRRLMDPFKLLKYKEEMKKCEASYNPCTDERRD